MKMAQVLFNMHLGHFLNLVAGAGFEPTTFGL